MNIDQSKTFDQINNMSSVELEKLLIGADEMLPNLKSVYLDNDQSVDVKFGRKIKCNELNTPQKVKLYDSNRKFIGIGECNHLSEVLPKRLFI